MHGSPARCWHRAREAGVEATFANDLAEALSCASRIAIDRGLLVCKLGRLSGHRGGQYPRRGPRSAITWHALSAHPRPDLPLASRPCRTNTVMHQHSDAPRPWSPDPVRGPRYPKPQSLENWIPGPSKPGLMIIGNSNPDPRKHEQRGYASPLVGRARQAALPCVALSSSTPTAPCLPGGPRVSRSQAFGGAVWPDRADAR